MEKDSPIAGTIPHRRLAAVLAGVVAIGIGVGWLAGHAVVEWLYETLGLRTEVRGVRGLAELQLTFDRLLPWLTVAGVAGFGMFLTYARGGVAPFVRAVRATLVVSIVAGAAYWGRAVHFALRFPFELDYGEGSVIAQIAIFLSGSSPYGPVNSPPFTIANYPPVFYFAAIGLSSLGLPVLTAARLVSALSWVAIIVMVGIGTAAATRDLRAKSARSLAVLVAMSAVVAIGDLVTWSTLARVDVLAIALALGGFTVFFRTAGRRRWGVWLAAALFVLSAFTRQSSIAAVSACLAVALMARPNQARQLAAGMAVGGVGGLGLALLLTRGLFWTHIVDATAHSYSLGRALDGVWNSAVVPHPLLVLTGLILGTRLARGLLHGDYSDRSLPESKGFSAERLRIGIGCFTIAAFLLLWTIGKFGSDDNYALEFLVACCLVLGVGVGLIIDRVTGKATPQPRLAAAWPVAIACVVSLQLAWAWAGLIGRWDRWQVAGTEADSLASVVAQIRGAEGDVMSEDMVALVAAGKTIEFQPFAMTQLHYQGKWDERPVRDRLGRGGFGLVVLRRDAAAERHANGTRFSAALLTTLVEHYRLASVLHAGTARAPYWIYHPVE